VTSLDVSEQGSTHRGGVTKSEPPRKEAVGGFQKGNPFRHEVGGGGVGTYIGCIGR